MKYLIAAAAILTVSTGAMAQASRYTYVYDSFSECKAAAKAAAKAGASVTDCRRVDGGWTFEASSCQDGQCMPD